MAKKATRESYGAALVKYGENPNIVVLDADLSKSTKTEMFKKAYPERFINMGIAESNMMCVAAGLGRKRKNRFWRQHLQCLPPAEPLNRLETQSAIQSLMLKSVLLTQVFLSVRTVRHINVLRTSL